MNKTKIILYPSWINQTVHPHLKNKSPFALSFGLFGSCFIVDTRTNNSFLLYLFQCVHLANREIEFRCDLSINHSPKNNWNKTGVWSTSTYTLTTRYKIKKKKKLVPQQRVISFGRETTISIYPKCWSNYIFEIVNIQIKIRTPNAYGQQTAPPRTPAYGVKSNTSTV